MDESSHETVQKINARSTGNACDVVQVPFSPNKNINKNYSKYLQMNKIRI